MVNVVQRDQTLSLLQAYQGLEELYAAMDGAARVVESTRAAPICIEGCGHCCEVNTPYLWDIEANYIISTVLGDGNISATLDRCQAWLLDRVAGLTLYGPQVDAQSTEVRLRILRETALAAATPCPFLESDTKRCAIHSTRPLTCRAYGVTRLPSQTECRAPLGPYETSQRRAIYVGAGGQALQDQANEFLRGLKPEWRAAYFAPTDIYRLASPTKFAALQDRFATAKMVAMPISPAVIWQSQLEEQWRRQGIR